MDTWLGVLFKAGSKSPQSVAKTCGSGFISMIFCVNFHPWLMQESVNLKLSGELGGHQCELAVR